MISEFVKGKCDELHVGSMLIHGVQVSVRCVGSRPGCPTNHRAEGGLCSSHVHKVYFSLGKDSLRRGPWRRQE